MKCEICNASMNQFEVDCFADLCSCCHEKFIKEHADFLKEDEETDE